jgi:hypothetical protein
MTECTPDTEECTAESTDTTPAGLPEAPLCREDADLDPGDATLADGTLAGDDLAAALAGHADGVSETTASLVAAVEAGDADAETLAAARTEVSELLAVLRDVRV